MTTIPVVNEWRAVLPELVEPSDDCVDADEFSYEDEAVHAASPFLCRLSRRCQRAGPFAPDSPVEERDSNFRFRARIAAAPCRRIRGLAYALDDKGAAG
jgi:hypothetical protein